MAGPGSAISRFIQISQAAASGRAAGPRAQALQLHVDPCYRYMILSVAARPRGPPPQCEAPPVAGASAPATPAPAGCLLGLERQPVGVVPPGLQHLMPDPTTFLFQGLPNLFAVGEPKSAAFTR